MKICPKCNRTYSDETLNFCLEDGSVLNEQQESAEPPPTVMVPAARESLKNEPLPTSPVEREIPTAPRQPVPAPKSSKAWLWAILIIVLLGLVCGGGLVGLAIIGSLDESQSGTEEPEEKDPGRETTKVDDFSEWSINENKFISSDKRNGELVLTSVRDYYYVVLTRDWRTYDATTLLTLRNVTGRKSGSGFGLVIHSYDDAVLERGYALLIRTDTGEYRIVQHRNKKETDLVKWTRSDTIKLGRSDNVLEARVYGRDMEFYINGKFVEKVRDKVGYRNGVAGIYTSDDIPIAFSRLELRK